MKSIYNKLETGKVSSTDHLPFADGSYDGITCVGSINSDHILIEDALKEFHRILKPKG